MRLSAKGHRVPECRCGRAGALTVLCNFIQAANERDTFSSRALYQLVADQPVFAGSSPPPLMPCRSTTFPPPQSLWLHCRAAPVCPLLSLPPPAPCSPRPLCHACSLSCCDPRSTQSPAAPPNAHGRASPPAFLDVGSFQEISSRLKRASRHPPSPPPLRRRAVQRHTHRLGYASRLDRAAGPPQPRLLWAAPAQTSLMGPCPS